MKYKYLLLILLLCLTGCRTDSNKSNIMIKQEDSSSVSDEQACLIAFMDAGVGEDELTKQEVYSENEIYFITFSTVYGRYSYQINEIGQINQVDWYLDQECLESLEGPLLTIDEAIEMIESKLNQVDELDYNEIEFDGHSCLKGSCTSLQRSCSFVLDLQTGLFLEWHLVND